jgi:hypothetical protein
MALWRPLALLTFCIAGSCLLLAGANVPVALDELPADHASVPVAVVKSQASFDLSALDPRDQYLIAVSSLSRDAGPFSVTVTTETVDHPHPIATARTEPDAAWRRRADENRRHLDLSRRVVPTAALRPSTVTPPAERSFWIMVRGEDFTQTSNYQLVRARLWAAGDHCAIYVDSDCVRTSSLDALVREARDTFDRDVFPTALRTLGRHRDVDGDGRFAILLTPWLGRLSEGTVSLGGFVRGSDFYNEVDPPLGNRCDMMYLNAELQPGPHVRTLIAHEYTHAVTLSEHVFSRYLPDRLGQEEESWLDESIAHLAENLHNYSWSNLDYRISAFLSDPERYRLVVDDYYAAGIWRGHGNRGSTYLFLRWCVDQYGEQILRNLVQTNLCGVESVEVAAGRPFEELYRDWSMALFLSNSGLETRPQEQFHFLSTRNELNGRLLAGPRHDGLRLDGDAQRFDLVGTSTKYFVAHSASATATRVNIRSTPDSQLQVTVRRLPRNLARLEVAAAPVQSSDAGPGAMSVRVQVKECNGVAVTLERLAWERSTSGTNRDADRGYCSAVLNEQQIEDLFGSSVVPASGQIVAEGLDLRSAAPTSEPLMIKVTGRDAAGHALSAWCPLPRRPVELHRTASTTDAAIR